MAQAKSRKRSKAKPTARTKARAKAAPAAESRAAEAARQAWSQAVRAVVAAEQQAEAGVRRLLDEKKKFEGSAAGRRLTRQLKELQARMQREKAAAGKRAGALVHQALASLNIPSRHEIAELRRSVEELGRRIDAKKRRK